MNILILSCGTRNKIVRYFKRELNGKGKVIAADCWELAPALYEADVHYVVPRITEEGYIDVILEICRKEQVKGLFSLIDPELSLLAQHKERFQEAGAMVFVSDYNAVTCCFDKGRMFDFCMQNHIHTVPTYKNFREFSEAYKEDKIQFPVFVKPINGSCSMQIQRVDDMETLEPLCKREPGLMIQKWMTGQEYGVDVYTDMITKEVVSIFIKKKLLMRAGETDKSVSVVRQDIFQFIKHFAEALGTVGQIDIDLFEQDGELYISEVNPRFGGGYPHAYECGVNFPAMMIKNLKNEKNEPLIGGYKEDIYMMKYLDVKIVDEQKQVLS